MSSNPRFVTTFEAENIIQPTYTGGDVAVDLENRILATCLGEEALLTDLNSTQLLARIEGDGEVLTALLLTPSASHLIACSRSLSMRMYALEDDEHNARKIINPVLQRTLKPHTTPVTTGTIDVTGSLLATGGADGVIKVWDIRGGYVSHTFRGHTGVISALFFFQTPAPPAATETSARHRSKSRKGQNVRGDGEAGDTQSSKTFFLASGSEDGKIRIWDLVKRKAIATLDSHVSVVRDFSYSIEENLLLSAGRDKTIILWDGRTWKMRKIIPVSEGVESAGFLGQDTLIYSGGEKGILRIWEFKSGREVTQAQSARGEGDGITHVLHLRSLEALLCVHADQTLVFHSFASLSTIEPGVAINPLPITRRVYGTHDEIIDLAYLTPNRELLALATNSEDVRLVSVSKSDLDPSSFAAGRYFGANIAILKGHEDIVICMDVDWSGCWLATGAKDNTAKLWRIDHTNRSYECFATFTGHAESLGAISLPGNAPPTGSQSSADPLLHPPRFLLTGSQDCTIKRWETTPKNSTKTNRKPSPRAIFTRKAHDKDINAISVNHNSTLFASASQDRTVKIWSVEEGEVQGVLRGHRRGVWSVQFAAKDTPPITGDHGLASSSRGLVLTGSGDKTVKIWSVADYSCLCTLEGHTNSVLKVLWMPLHYPPDHYSEPDNPTTTTSHGSSSRNTSSSVQVVSAGGDGLVKIWSVNAGECDCTLDNHIDRVWALALDPASRTLVSGGADSVVTFWTDSSAASVAARTAAATVRVEQEQQLQNYIHRRSYREAITLALQLNHPARLLALFTAVVQTDPPELDALSGVRAVDEVLGDLADAQAFRLLVRLREWNTNARTAAVAQRILWVLVKTWSAERLAGLKRGAVGSETGVVGEEGGRKARGGSVALGEVLDGLRVYTERHYRRMEELVDESYVVDWTLREMEAVGFVDGEGGELEVNGGEDMDVDGDVGMTNGFEKHNGVVA